jgi:hypothetical protein
MDSLGFVLPLPHPPSAPTTLILSNPKLLFSLVYLSTKMIDEPDCCLTRSSSWRFASNPHIDISRKNYAGMSLPSGTWPHFTMGR